MVGPFVVFVEDLCSCMFDTVLIKDAKFSVIIFVGFCLPAAWNVGVI
jgi:hypothetical protein